ncbi:MAG: carbohydrate binding domain-containing protein [Prevotella sp.]|nr:carbohydrate binding domain-containing protein [Prevotella sp.]
MKKRLLLSLVALMGVGTMFAANVGDYVFTTDAKFKVIGDNIINNGSFAANYDSWTDAVGLGIDPEFWSIEEGQGPEGQNVIMSLSNADEQTAAYLFQAIPFEPSKSYIITLKVKGVEGTTSSVTYGGANYIDVYANGDGSLNNKDAENRYQQVATTQAVREEWTEYNFSFTDTVSGGSNGYIIVAVGRLAPQSQVTAIEVREVTQVYDTRIAERKLAWAKEMYEIEDFTNKKGYLADLIPGLEACLSMGSGEPLGLDLDDFSAMESFMTEFDGQVNEYLNQNSYDLIEGGNISNGKFTAMPDLRNGSTGSGDWHWGGSGRWFHRTGSGYDPSKLYDYIQASYDLGEGFAYIEKALPAGKYMFKIDVRGYVMAGTSSALRYTPNYDSKVEGCKLFFGEDSIDIGTLDTRNYQSYYILRELKDGETLKVGFYHPQLTNGTKLGGQIDLAEPFLRRVGADAAGEISAYILNNTIMTNAHAARVMIDSAIVIKPKVEFPWGKEELQAAIDKNEADYAAMMAAEQSQEVADSLTEIMRNMRGDIQTYYAYNKPYTDLVAAMPAAQESYDSPANASADPTAKAAFKAAIDRANALINGVTSTRTDEDVTNFEEALANIIATKKDFEFSTASYANPAGIVIVNAKFEQYSGGNTSNFSATGWDVVNATTNGKFAYGANSNFELGTRVSSWRGSTGNAFNKISQKVTLTTPGAYEFVCQAYAYNETGSRDTGYEVPSGIKYFAKAVESADSLGSLDIHTYRVFVDTLGYGVDTPEWFVITLNKTDNVPTEYEFGLDALSHDGYCNTYAYGSQQINYYGNYNNYVNDVKSNLQAAVNDAQSKLGQLAEEVILANNEPQQVRNAANKAAEALASNDPAAQTRWLKMLNRAAAGFEVFITGVKGVVAEDLIPAKQPMEGVYNISGVKVGNSLQDLPKGIYIYNGKKYIVR